VKADPRITKTQEMVYEMRVGDVMSREVITVKADDLMSSLRELLRRNRISGVPVLDEDRLAGLISLEDFIKWLADREADCTIGERMTGNLVTLDEDDPLVLAIGKFESTGLGRFPVTDSRQGRLVGILTKGDVIEGLLKKLEIDYHQEEIHHYRPSDFFRHIEAESTTLVFQYDVKGKDIKQAGSSASRLKRTLKRLGMRPDVVRRVGIASYEAEMNLVIFTEGGKVRATVQPGRVFVEVEDSGPGIPDIEKALQPGYSTAPDWVRELGFGAGMGLVNIRKCSDTFDIYSEPGKGTLLRASFFASEEEDETGRPGARAGSGRGVGSRAPR